MTREEQLVELKVNLAMDESLSDVQRLTAKIIDVFDHCNLLSNKNKASRAKTRKLAKEVIAQCERTRLFCLNCKKHYPRPAKGDLSTPHALSIAIDNCLAKQSVKVLQLIQTLSSYHIPELEDRAVFF